MVEEYRGLPTFDIEVVGWTVPIAVGFYDGYDYAEFIKEKEEDDPIWDFLTYLKRNYSGLRVYAHCASRFDNKFILSTLSQKDEKLRLESGLLRLKWAGPNISFEDSFPLLPMPLKKMNHMFGVLEKGEWAHDLNLKPWEMGDRLGVFKEYLKTDCISLSQSLGKFCQSLGQNFGITPSISLSTTSVKAFSKCFYPVEKIESNEKFEEFIRQATYGGRNEVYKRYGENINIYDVNSMFVSCYDIPVPVGPMHWDRPNIDKEGLAEAVVSVPKDRYIGPLPYRVKGRLVFPVGEFKSWWDIRELRYAASLGIDLTIKRQLVCEEEPILEEFGRFVDKLRKKKKETQLWKMFGISLSGKFGQGRWRESIRHASEIKDFTDYTPLGEDEIYFIIKEYVGGRAPYIKPAISMRIRAEARVRHLKMIMKAMETGKVFYGDTDSVFTTSELDCGENLGQLNSLGIAERGYFIKQKLYAIIQKGKIIQRSAGYSDLKLTEEDFKGLLSGTNIEKKVTDLPPMKELLRGKDIHLLEKIKRVRGEESLSRLPVGEDTEPIRLP